MSNAEIIAKIRTEIERRIKAHHIHDHFCAEHEFRDVLSFLSDLEKSEKPMNLDEEIKEFVAEYDYERSEDIILIATVARHFYDLGCRRTAEKYDEIEYNRQRASGSSEIPNDQPLPEDTALFQKGIEEGKRLMMEEAVEIGTTDICWEQDGDRSFPTFDPPVEDLLMPGIISQRFKDGDKVRVIIIKKEVKE